MKILVTGAAGFIGSTTARRLLARGDEVVGLDNLNDYYDVNLKKARLAILEKQPRFRFVLLDLANREGMEALFRAERFERVIHLGAQAGVRYSIQNPHAYVESNITGTLHVLEGCRHHGVEHLVFASTSSVYGANTKMPFSVHQNVDHPLSFYAATKKANELMAKAQGTGAGDANIQYSTGVLHINAGRHEEAAAAFKRAIAIDPNHVESYYHLGTIALNQNNMPEAIAYLEKYLSLNPTNAQNVATAQGLIKALKPAK